MALTLSALVSFRYWILNLIRVILHIDQPVVRIDRAPEDYRYPPLIPLAAYSINNIVLSQIAKPN